jgi:chaperonin GroEL (HSP60 family)
LQQQEVSDEAAVEAARIIAEIWTRTLGPEGLTVVTSGSTLSDAAVTFFETPSEE